MNTSEMLNVVNKLIRFVSTICLGLIAIGAIVAGTPRTAAATTIVTDQGPLKSTNITTAAALGYYPMNGTEYLGIPYAAPPVGNLRWKPPQLAAPFKGVFEANGSLTRSCAQPDGAGGLDGDENCLFLNVYVPKTPQPARGFPVMVWIHGGALVVGRGFSFDPQPIVDGGGVIVVTINYRLGYLGFFAHPALDAEGHLAGNYGLLDQQFALQWVCRNIGAFGGDRKRVTLFGESAGGLSVYSNLASPTAAGLFQRAIAESGAAVTFAGHFPFTDYLSNVVSLATGESTGSAGFGVVPSGLDAATSVGCASQTADCLRAVSALTLVNVEPGFLYPFVDGTVLTQTPGEAIGSGQFNRVPVISGSNHDEWRFYIALTYDLGPFGPLTAADYPQAVYSFLLLPGPPPDNAFGDYVLALYPLSADSASPSIGLGALGTDVVYACPARNADLSLSQYVPTYSYEFNDETAPSFLPPLSFPLGDAHLVEEFYLFNLGFTFTPDQQQLSNTMIRYWTQFAKTGNPNSAEAPTWSQYSAGGSFQSLVAPTPVTESDTSFDADHNCSSLWNLL